MALESPEFEDFQLVALEKHLTSLGSEIAPDLLSVLAKVRIAVDARGLDREKKYYQDYSKFGAGTIRRAAPSDPRLFPSKRNRRVVDPKVEADATALLAYLGISGDTTGK